MPFIVMIYDVIKKTLLDKGMIFHLRRFELWTAACQGATRHGRQAALKWSKIAV